MSVIRRSEGWEMRHDKELLQLASQVSGLQVEWNADAKEFTHPKQDGTMLVETSWNPLLDDGDALRLAVALNLGIEFDDDERATNILNRFGALLLRNMWFDDMYAATRRAIVRAAVDISIQLR